MEELSQLGVGGSLWGGFVCATSPAAKTAGDSDAATVAMVAALSGSASTVFEKGRRHSCCCIPSPPLLLNTSNNQCCHQLQAQHEIDQGASSSFPDPGDDDLDSTKAKIISHPHFSNLLAAYIDCQKVGAPAEVAARLSAVARELKMGQWPGSLIRRDGPTDPELDQFMEAYHEMLVKYREELTRPLKEAMEFFRRVESQLNFLSLTDAPSLRILSSGTGEDQDWSGRETEFPELDACAEDKELKHLLLKKYSGRLSSLRQELSKKRKKGKLPKDALQQLLNWWELHYKWPYPSESQKAALSESTGLDLKQINNWFINQRKRHWKPSELDMQFLAMDANYNAPQINADDDLYMDGL